MLLSLSGTRGGRGVRGEQEGIRAMQIRWGLVGLGRLAEEHLAGAFAGSRDGKLVACAGRTESRAKEYAV